ncbi:flavin reductase family protein [Glaciihabitans sp. dw_435]|uniref:flavin reductase family protein n=1 Tax=Glaciihabitans sp. dw_435 TaxID=2720081 RepID=UPI001BD42C3A|nr:flavin reductase family protein [Glaciihabitans sp. dw_435]
MQNVSVHDTAAVETAFAGFPSGVAALTAMVDGVPTGLVATSFTVGVSFDPPLVLFSVQDTSATWPLLRTAARIGVSVLGRDHEDVCIQLASRNRDRFEGVSTHTTDAGAIFIEESVTWLDCTISAEIPTGDHTIVVLAVSSIRHSPGKEPLIYHDRAFRALVEHAEAAADIAA